LSRRRSKGGKGAPEQGILDELTNPPIAFNILSVIILLGASAMVTDATGKQVKKKGGLINNYQGLMSGHCSRAGSRSCGGGGGGVDKVGVKHSDEELSNVGMGFRAPTRPRPRQQQQQRPRPRWRSTRPRRRRRSRARCSAAPRPRPSPLLPRPGSAAAPSPRLRRRRQQSLLRPPSPTRQLPRAGSAAQQLHPRCPPRWSRPRARLPCGARRRRRLLPSPLPLGGLPRKRRPRSRSPGCGVRPWVEGGGVASCPVTGGVP